MSLSANFPTIRPSLSLDFANTKQLDPRITFSRASTATYYDGVTTAKAEENLYAVSTGTTPWIDTARLNIQSTSETAPDGTSTAILLRQVTGDTSGGYVGYISYPYGIGDYTVSCYAKAGASNFMRIVIHNSTFAQVYFNLSAGTIDSSSGSGTFTSAISSVGNGWYRCSVTATRTTASSGLALFYLADAAGSSTVTPSVSSFAFWGPQIEQRSSITAYTPTTSQAITNYIPVLQTAGSGSARFDHNPTTGESLGLLIEEQRTNLVVSSAALQNWGVASAAVTVNTIVAPDGTISGEKFSANSTYTYHYVGQSIATTSGVQYAFSAYFKQGENRYANFLTNTGGTYYGIGIDMQTGTIVTNSVGVTQASGTITAVGNGWYRATMVMTSPSTGTTEFRITSSNSINTSWSFAGDGFSGFYVWGAQVEVGAFPTSYIPTTSAQVTRSADAASMTGTNFSSWYDAGEGTVYADWVTGAGLGNGQYPLAIDDGTTNNFIYMQRSSGNVLEIGALANNTSQASMSLNAAIGSNVSVKVAFAVARNDYVSSFNGGAVVTDTVALMPIVNKLVIGNRTDGARTLNSTIKKIAYYPARLTNAELQGLTS